MNAVFKREVASYFKNVTGYLIAAFLLVFSGIYCMAYNLSGYYSNFEYVISAICFIYLIAVPILSMRVLAEEKRQKTEQLLYSLPIRLSSVVMGKYLAMLVVLALPCAIMGLYPLILSQFGSVSFGPAYGSLFAFFLMGAALLSIGMFISSMTESQIASAVICLLVMLLLYFMTSLASFVSTEASSSLVALLVLAILTGVILQLLCRNPIVSFGVAAVLCAGLLVWYNMDTGAFSGLFATVMTSVSVFDRLDPFIDGIFDLTSVAYWISCIAVFLFLTVQSLEKRRWGE